MLTDDAYAVAAGSLVASPVEWVVGAMRSLHVPTDDDTVKKAAGAMRALGQLPFFPPNVSGWPSGQAWLPRRRRRRGCRRRRSSRGSVTSSRCRSRRPRGAWTSWRTSSGSRPSDRTLAELRTHTNDPQRLVAMALVSPENLVI